MRYAGVPEGSIAGHDVVTLREQWLACGPTFRNGGSGAISSLCEAWEYGVPAQIDAACILEALFDRQPD